MDAGKYYVLGLGNNLYESMTKEQIIAAIAEATGETPTDIDAAFITKIKEGNRNSALKFWIGTTAEYNALQSYEPNCFYIFTDSDEMNEIIQAAEDAAEQKANEICGALQEDVEQAQEDIAQAKNDIEQAQDDIEDIQNTLAKKGVQLCYSSDGDLTNKTVTDIDKYTLVKVFSNGSVLCTVSEGSSGGTDVYFIQGVGTQKTSDGTTTYNSYVNILVDKSTKIVYSNKSVRRHIINGATEAKISNAVNLPIYEITGIL